MVITEGVTVEVTLMKDALGSGFKEGVGVEVNVMVTLGVGEG
jgi:hypothetical protein